MIGGRIAPLSSISQPGTLILACNDRRNLAHSLRLSRQYPHLKVLDPWEWRYFRPKEALVFNRYDLLPESQSEEGYICAADQRKRKQGIESLINEVVNESELTRPLFTKVQIETINRCNNLCSFCPVNRNAEQRPYARMTSKLFYSIIDQLADMDYRDGVLLSGNNEPLLDTRIVEFARYAREKLPQARLYLFTNGTLLNNDLLEALAACFDELVIDNYSDELTLIPPVLAAKEYCEAHPEETQCVTICIRKMNEILETRAGIAPNRTNIPDYGDLPCVMPYQNLAIRPSGKISYCTIDAYGRGTLGDVNHQTLLEIWRGDAYNAFREKLLGGRKNVDVCAQCDSRCVRG